VGFYKLDLCDLLVISDEMALDPGMIRLRAKGSAGGHNGLADIIEKLGTNEFARLRVGIGQSGMIDSVGYVLGLPSNDDKQLLDEAIGRAAEAVKCWVESGTEAAMNEFNVQADL
ncbi:aminoacyl-tRNA hydrolase, partial [Planctomycetota bacterium]